MRGLSMADFGMILFAMRWTVALALASFAIGSVVALLVASARTARAAWLRALARAYIELVQGIPLLGLLFLLYFGVPMLTGWQVDAFLAAVVAFSLSAGAFLGDIWRGSIEAVPKGQWESAACVGLRRLQVLRHVIWPQAARIALPPTIGYLVQLIKNTSLAALVGLVELTRAGQIVSGSTLQHLPVFCAVALCYFAVCYPLARYALYLEGRMHVARGH
ncbi:amino acid ABC transporter permease [Paracidovorax cattleyae]|uniref:Amino acid ABC transporter membrane protein 2, PAAT family n=1 Tax=Paracidovorax cattleyae TaxID=80868 RepID=A0A1H0RCS4_9BURK|nr:amino acid ABC transporter permease [Paracidovorax cattleyae]MBF9266245.1 amino acid ABC transporter permease [Paracidovorax cattleyae]SDP27353.1 amino acid ABC transporter membrane protein 2, PAAT family [Paracidovorax cattleyae]